MIFRPCLSPNMNENSYVVPDPCFLKKRDGLHNSYACQPFFAHAINGNHQSSYFFLLNIGIFHNSGRVLYPLRSLPRFLRQRSFSSAVFSHTSDGYGTMIDAYFYL